MAANDIAAARDELLNRHAHLNCDRSISSISQYPSDTGGFADIYQGQGPDGQTLAVKFIRESTSQSPATKVKILRAWRQEFSIWREAKHANIQNLIGVYWNPGVRGPNVDLPGLVSKWQTNGNMAAYLREPRFPPGEERVYRLNLLKRVLHGLDYLHSGYTKQPVIHGDVKAANVLISSQGEPLLCDFGASWTAAKRSVSFTLNRSNGKGTPEHMAPEFFPPNDNAPETLTYTTSSDIWAFGCLIYEVLLGSPPWEGVYMHQVMWKLSQGIRFSRPEGIHDADWSIVDNCCAMEPHLRPTAKIVLSQF